MTFRNVTETRQGTAGPAKCLHQVSFPAGKLGIPETSARGAGNTYWPLKASHKRGFVVSGLVLYRHYPLRSNGNLHTRIHAYK